MNKIIASLLTLSQITAFCAFFALAPIATAHSSTYSSNLTVKSSPAISVVSASQTGEVKFVTPLNNCLFVSNNSSQNLVQDQAGINLNQQQNCFNLSLGRTSVQSKLYVQNVNLKSVSIAVKNHEEYSKNSLTNKNSNSKTDAFFSQNNTLSLNNKISLSKTIKNQSQQKNQQLQLSTQNTFSLIQLFRC